LSYNREVKLMERKNDMKTKVHCNTNRICEVEDAVVEWIAVTKEDAPKLPININHLIKTSE
jgi:hypothetical protein